MNTPVSSPRGRTTGPSKPQTSQLFVPICVVMVGLLGYFATHNDVQSSLHLQLGLLMVFLAFVPILRWAKKAKTSLPVFEVFMFTCANTYAFPLLNGHAELVRYTVDEISTAAVG